jgi:GT2 family glycosyltransferase
VEEYGNPVSPAERRAVGAAPSEESVKDIEARPAMLGGEAPEQASAPPRCAADVVHARAEQVPLGGIHFLIVRVDVHVVAAGESLDEPEDGGDDAMRPAAVHSTMNQEGQLHGAEAIDRRVQLRYSGMPTVSVILPTYDRRELLEHAVTSVLDQTHQDWELIIANDGSGDATREYLDGLRDARVRVLHLAHSGSAAKVRNAAIELARGEWVAFLDSDDLWLPQKLERQLAALTAMPQAGWSCTDVLFIDADGASIERRAGAPYHPYSGWILELLLAEVASATTPTIMVRRSLMEQLSGFDETLLHREDRDMTFRLAARSQICALAEPLTLVRQHGGRQTSLAEVVELHRFNELVFRKASVAAPTRSARRIATRQCATELVAMATGLSHHGQHRAALAAAVRAIRDAPFSPLAWRSLAGCASRGLRAGR